MEDFEVKKILTSKLQMTKYSSSDNYRRKESRIQKIKAGVLRALGESINVFVQSSNVWARLVDLST
jgi:hypothetical protein